MLFKKLLSEKAIKTIDHFLIHSNRRDAYCHGFGKYNGASATKFFDRPAIIAEIQRRRKQAEENSQISLARVIAEIGKIAFAPPPSTLPIYVKGGRVYLSKPLSEWTPEEQAAIQFIEGDAENGVRIKFYSKSEALKTLAAHLGAFDKKAAEPGDTGKVVLNITI